MQSNKIEFPDANNLRALNQMNKKAEYKQWYADNEEVLSQLATEIRTRNALGHRTMGFKVPRTEVWLYKKFLIERHFEVEFCDFICASKEYSKYKFCVILWAYKGEIVGEDR